MVDTALNRTIEHLLYNAIANYVNREYLVQTKFSLVAKLVPSAVAEDAVRMDLINHYLGGEIVIKDIAVPPFNIDELDSLSKTAITHQDRPESFYLRHKLVLNAYGVLLQQLLNLASERREVRKADGLSIG